MAKFVVTVMRRGIAFRDMEVEADNKAEGKLKAVDKAGSFEFSEKESEYKAVGIYQKE
ncbi:MAG TPA: hypothetical protein VMW10_11575 [Alphaproteobacteria bacterium]|nr:hypothetical protein [Alphaproteobacteria bacterium]